jgi:hypothetical protein
MTSKLFWVVVFSAAVCIGVLNRGRVTRWIYYKQAEARWKIVAEDVPFVDYEGCTPTAEEIADRFVERYTKCNYLSFDVDTHVYGQRWWSHARYLAAAGKAKRVIHIGSLSVFGCGAERLTFTGVAKAGVISEEWIVAKDGTRLAASGSLDELRAIRLESRIPGYICGMANNLLLYSPIKNDSDRRFTDLHSRLIRGGKVQGTLVVTGRRCVVTCTEDPTRGEEFHYIISPDYYILQRHVHEDGCLVYVQRFTNYSSAPIPDEEFE